MVAKRGLSKAHTAAGNVSRNQQEHRGCVDETYLKVRSERLYLNRVVNRVGNTVGFRLSPRSDVAAANAFRRKVIRDRVHGPSSWMVLPRLPAPCAR